jgi:RNA polymerase-binding transcription factor DksA
VAVAAKPKTAVAPRVIGRPAVKGRPGLAVKGTPNAGVKGKPKLAVAKRTFDPTVRPLGVLPPEMLVKSSGRPPLAAPVRAPAAPVRAIKDNTKTPGVQRVTEKDYKEFEERLLVERRKIMKEMGHLETTVLKVNPRDSAGDLSGYSFHMADAGTDAMEREKAFLLASAEGRILMEINEALRRLYRSEFGECEICSQPIGRARLEAMPYTRLCLSCKEKEERTSRGAP